MFWWIYKFDPICSLLVIVRSLHMDRIIILWLFHQYRISHARISLGANFRPDLTNAVGIISMYFQCFTVKSYKKIVFLSPVTSLRKVTKTRNRIYLENETRFWRNLFFVLHDFLSFSTYQFIENHRTSPLSFHSTPSSTPS